MNFNTMYMPVEWPPIPDMTKKTEEVITEVKAKCSYQEVYEMARKSKKEMIKEMKECGWHPSCDEKDSWDDVKEEYDTFMDETSDDSVLFPNGRDYDAEDEDGPF